MPCLMLLCDPCHGAPNQGTTEDVHVHHTDIISVLPLLLTAKIPFKLPWRTGAVAHYPHAPVGYIDSRYPELAAVVYVASGTPPGDVSLPRASLSLAVKEKKVASPPPFLRGQLSTISVLTRRTKSICVPSTSPSPTSYIIKASKDVFILPICETLKQRC
jgi:hypothetical protein